METAVGVVIGRFQVDEVHNGHLHLLMNVADKHPRLVVLLGCSRSVASRDNPLNYQIRAEMIRELLPRAVILPVFDCQTDIQWSYQVDTVINAAFPLQPAVLYGGRKSFIPHYSGRHETRELDFGIDFPSGSDRRHTISANTRESADFRAGVIHALNNLPPQSVPCVDVVVYRKLNAEYVIVLGRKDNEVGWRIPGGHVDVTDSGYEQAARRECMEETGISCESTPQYVGSFAVDDWRTRSRTDIKYFTTLFAVPYSWGPLKAGDDLAEAEWFTLDHAQRAVLQDHLPLVTAARKYLESLPEVAHVTD